MSYEGIKTIKMTRKMMKKVKVQMIGAEMPNIANEDVVRADFSRAFLIMHLQFASYLDLSAGGRGRR